MSQCELIGIKIGMCVRCRFVRSEKEIAVARCDASDREALRYKQRVEHQDRQLKELEEALNSEREKMQVQHEVMESCKTGIPLVALIVALLSLLREKKVGIEK